MVNKFWRIRFRNWRHQCFFIHVLYTFLLKVMSASELLENIAENFHPSVYLELEPTIFFNLVYFQVDYICWICLYNLNRNVYIVDIRQNHMNLSLRVTHQCVIDNLNTIVHVVPRKNYLIQYRHYCFKPLEWIL